MAETIVKIMTSFAKYMKPYRKQKKCKFSNEIIFKRESEMICEFCKVPYDGEYNWTNSFQCCFAYDGQTAEIGETIDDGRKIKSKKGEIVILGGSCAYFVIGGIRYPFKHGLIRGFI